VIFNKETDFQETTLGRIPREWHVKKAEEVGEVVTGITPSTFIKEYWNGNYPFVTPTDMTDGKYVEKTERKVTTEGLKKGRLIPKDSVLVTCIASIGKMGLAFEDCLTNQQINAIICKNEVNPHYVYYALGFRSHILKNWAGRTTNPIIKKSMFEKFPIPIPSSYFEQAKIAEVLSYVDLAVQKTGEVIAKTERLKKGLMQQLLTKGIGHKEFKDSEIGKIPKEWQVVRLREITTLTKGKAPKSMSNFKKENTLPYLSAESLRTGSFAHWAKPMDDVVKIGKDDIILIWDGFYCGDVFTGYEGILSSTMVRIDVNESHLNRKFLFYIIKTHFKELNSKISGMYLKHVNKHVFESLKIPLPSYMEQQRIVDILSNVDRKLKLEEREISKLERIKQSLMGLLLTGKVRVRVD
jgi:type I restriction enzyme S subunit